MALQRTPRVVFGVILGTGGGVVDRQVHVGRDKVAGEWGHNSLHSQCVFAAPTHTSSSNEAGHKYAYFL